MDRFLRYSIKSCAAGLAGNTFLQGIIQDSTTTQWNKPITFPLSFPNKCLLVMHKPNLNYDADGWHSALLTAKDISKTGYTAWMVDGGGFVSLAFGY